MLDNFRKKDNARPSYTPPPSPYGRMQEALSPTPAAAETPKPEAPRAEIPKPELPKPESPRADAVLGASIPATGGPSNGLKPVEKGNSRNLLELAAPW